MIHEGFSRSQGGSGWLGCRTLTILSPPHNVFRKLDADDTIASMKRKLASFLSNEIGDDLIEYAVLMLIVMSGSYLCGRWKGELLTVLANFRAF